MRYPAKIFRSQDAKPRGHHGRYPFRRCSAQSSTIGGLLPTCRRTNRGTVSGRVTPKSQVRRTLECHCWRCRLANRRVEESFGAQRKNTVCIALGRQQRFLPGFPVNADIQAGEWRSRRSHQVRWCGSGHLRSSGGSTPCRSGRLPTRNSGRPGGRHTRCPRNCDRKLIQHSQGRRSYGACGRRGFVGSECQAAQRTTNTEVVITTSLIDSNRYLMRKTDVYYIEDVEGVMFEAPFRPQTKAMGVTGQ
jgi:hypothetical protein